MAPTWIRHFLQRGSCSVHACLSETHLWPRLSRLNITQSMPSRSSSTTSKSKVSKACRSCPGCGTFLLQTRITGPFSSNASSWISRLKQVGHIGPRCPSEVDRPIPYIDTIALKFPQLRIICGHVGWPWAAEAVSVAWKYPNVYIDTSAWSPKYYANEFLQFANTRATDVHVRD